jgi:L-alanine-DL-glutamate epimerase-like enolase superfamily enzyme
MTAGSSIVADGHGGFLLRVDDGDVFEGVAAAFPGRTGPCRADDVESAWRALQNVDDDVLGLADRVRRHPAPAACAAFQVALARKARATAQSQTALLAHELSLVPASSVRTAGLVLDAGQAGIPPTPTLKWKTPPADARTLHAFVRRAPATTLRLDGNRALSFDDAVVLADVCGAGLQFVEEPCPTVELGRCAARLPLALDESLLDCDLDVDDALQLGAHVLVLKPAALGPARTLTLALQARRHGLHVVISGVGEGPSGLRALVALHAVVGTLDAGLGTYVWRDDTRTLFACDGTFRGALP